MREAQLLAEDLIGMQMLVGLGGEGSKDTVWEYLSVSHPRLRKQVTTDRNTFETAEVWFVDELAVGELEDAVAVLNGDKDHVPIAKQIATLKDLIKRDPEAIGRVIDPDRPIVELQAALSTLEWNEANAGELRAFRKWKRDHANGN